MLSRLSTKLILFNSHYESPCSCVSNSMNHGIEIPLYMPYVFNNQHLQFEQHWFIDSGDICCACMCTKTLSVFIVQNVALSNFGVASHQQSNGAINCSLAMLYDIWRHRDKNLTKILWRLRPAEQSPYKSLLILWAYYGIEIHKSFFCTEY